MKKNIKNIISITILIFVMCVLIISVKTVNKNQTLSSSSSSNFNEEIVNDTNFEYITARESLNTDIKFENNFGGENDDFVNSVYKLEHYYLIGTTKSTRCYFNNLKTPALYILICDYNGNTVSVHTISFNYEITYITEKLCGNNFYILIKTNLVNVIKFNLNLKTFETIYSTNNLNCELIVSGEPILLEKLETETKLTYLVTNKTTTLQQIIEQTYLSCEYLNGTLLFYLSNNTVNISTIINNKVNNIKTFVNCTLENFTITEENFVLVFNENKKLKVIILDMLFNTEKEIVLNSGNNVALHYNNNTYYLFYKNNNNLFATTFCKHGDILINEKLLEEQIENFNILLLNNNFLILTDKKEEIKIIKVNFIFDKVESKTFIDNFKTTYFEANSTALTIFGETENNKNTVTKNFGKRDVFILEINIF